MGHENLTKRENEVFRLILRGYTTKQIALMLNLSYKMIEVHRQAVNVKLGAGNVAQLFVYAYQHGILKEELGDVVCMQA